MRRILIVLPAMVAGIAAVVVYLATSKAASLPENPTAAQVNSFVMSPFCPGLTLDECPTDQAASLRSEIAERIREGSSGQEMETWLVSTYGEGVLGKPRRLGIFVLPAVLLGVGFALLMYALRAWRNDPSATTDTPPQEAWESERLRSELEAFAGGTE